MVGTRPAHDPLREERVERVRLGICETIVPFDLRVGADEDCRTEIHSLDLGMIRIVCASGGPLEGEVLRTPRLIRDSDPDLCKIDVQLRGRDPQLTPGRIAAAHHISLRYLYRLFEAEQTSVGSWIRGRRLDHCRRDLTDPALAGRPVSAIGARWGFVDATHFTRAFKAAYGVTPGDYRRLCVGPDRSPG